MSELTEYINFNKDILFYPSQEKLLNLAYNNIKLYCIKFDKHINVIYHKDYETKKGYFEESDDKVLDNLLFLLVKYINKDLKIMQLYGDHLMFIYNTIENSKNIKSLKSRFTDYDVYFGEDNLELAVTFKNEINELLIKSFK